MGKAVEYLVAATCILASRAEMNVSTSMVDDEGIDLVFHRRGGTATLAVQVKSRMSDASITKAGSFMTSVRLQTFDARPDVYLLFVPIDVATATFEFAWLVPSLEYRELAAHDEKRSRLRMAASTRAGSNDKWSGYRVPRTELAGRILSVLQALDEG